MSETSNRRPPGPKPHFLIGNLPLASPEPLAVFAKWAREFGDIFYYRAAWIRGFFINRPDLIESVTRLSDAPPHDHSLCHQQLKPKRTDRNVNLANDQNRLIQIRNP